MERSQFFVIFLSLGISILFFYIPDSALFSGYKIATSLAYVVAAGMLFGFRNSAASLLVLLGFAFLQGILPFVVIVEFHLALFFLALFFVHKNLDKIITEKITGRRKFFKSALHGIGLFLVIAALSIMVTLALFFAGVQPDASKVFWKVSQLPLYILLFAALFAPLSEELFFRAFLAKKFGVAVSAVAFSLSHIVYGSAYELAGAFAIGLALAYYFVREKNLVPCIIAHSLFNLASITLMLLAKRLV